MIPKEESNGREGMAAIKNRKLADHIFIHLYKSYVYISSLVLNDAPHKSTLQLGLVKKKLDLDENYTL